MKNNYSKSLIMENFKKVPKKMKIAAGDAR